MVSGLGVDTHCLTKKHKIMFSEKKRLQLLEHISKLETELIELTTVVINKDEQPSNEELVAIRISLLFKSDNLLSALSGCLIEEI